MLWIPGPNEILMIVIVWVLLTLGPGLFGIVYLIRRWRRKKAGQRIDRPAEPGRETSP